MKYFFLIWKNLKRNKRRTVLTVLSVAVALFLFSTIHTVIATMEATIQNAAATPVLVVQDRYMPFSNNLPEAYLPKLAAVPGVEAVLPANFIGGTVKGDLEEVRFAAIDPTVAREVWTDLQQVPEESWQAFVRERKAAIMGQGNMGKYNWRIGDEITLRLQYHGTIDIPLRIVGVSPPGLFGDAGYLHREYLRELLSNPGIVGMYYLRVRDFSAMARISADIDRQFANAATPTRTEPMSKFVARFVDSLGNLQQVISGFVASILITIIVIAANTMAMAVRERQSEVALLKTLGFRRSHVLAFVVGESTLMALCGGVLGNAVAYFLLSGIRLPIGGVGAFFVVTAKTVVAGLVISILVGICSGFLPGFFAARKSIVEALRKVG